MENVPWGFDTLPKEIKQLIFSFTDLDATTVLRIQSVSSSFKRLCWAWVRNLNAYVPDVINRVNGELIRSVDCSKWKDPVNSVMALLKIMPNLERIHFSLKEGDSELSIIANKISELDRHPKLCQIGYRDGFWVRSTTSNASRKFNRYREAVTQMDPVVLDKTYHRGGILSDKVTEKDSKMIVIGATDGTLQFLTLDREEDEWDWSENALKAVLTKNDIHKDCINAIWSEAFIFYQSPTYISSSDGIVSSWSCTNDEPVLHKIFEFPESILFVCEYAEKYVLAAGKRTLYIAEIETNKIIQEIAVDDDITGLFCLNKIVALSTKDSIYSLKENTDDDDGGAFVLQKEFSLGDCPNMWLSPDALLRTVVHSTYFDLRTNATNELTERVHVRDLVNDSGVTFDTRPHLTRFSPIHHWLTVCAGNSLHTYDLETHGRILTMSPSMSESVTEYPEKCNAFWYAANGRLLFSLYSNNTLCWWRSCLLQISRGVGE